MLLARRLKDFDKILVANWVIVSLRDDEMILFWYLEFGIRRSSFTHLRTELARCVLVFSCEIVELDSKKKLPLIITWQTILEADRSALFGVRLESVQLVCLLYIYLPLKSPDE